MERPTMPDYQHLTRHSPSTGRGSPDVWGVYEAATGSIQYVVACPETKAAVVIDTVLNFDPAAARTSAADCPDARSDRIVTALSLFANRWPSALTSKR